MNQFLLQMKKKLYNITRHYIMEKNFQDYDNLRKKVKTDEKPLFCSIEATAQYSRSLTVSLPHGQVFTPVFMPVGTKGTIKGLTSLQMEELGCRILLSNTYHLENKPGTDFLSKVGGLHKFMNWPRNILTDSGGFQMVSLSKLCEINEQGVKFESPYDKTIMFIRPEDSIKMQNKIGSDIMMALDDVIKTTTQGPRMEEAMLRTNRWISRNMQANQNPKTQNLFPIVQGGITPEFRITCLQHLIKTDANGFAIGGLSGGQKKEDFFKIVRLCCSQLPPNKPRYLMGVGFPVDIVLCIIQGVDMFDCVFPTRTARFGTAFTSFGEIKLHYKEYATDFQKLQNNCNCETCKHFTRAYLHSIHKHDNFCHLLSIHNIHFLFDLTKKMKQAIQANTVSSFVRIFLNEIYGNEKKIPKWVDTALKYAQIEIQLEYPFY